MSFLQRVTRYGNWYLRQGQDRSDKIQRMRGHALVLALHCSPILLSCGLLFAHNPWLPFLLALSVAISVIGLWVLRQTGRVGLVASTHVLAMQILASFTIVAARTFVSFLYVLVPYHVIIMSLIAGSSRALSVALICLSLALGTILYTLGMGVHLPFNMSMLDYALGAFATITVASSIVAFLSSRFEKLRVEKELSAIQDQNSLNQSMNLICLGNLVGNINHEFNNALGIIHASLENIERAQAHKGNQDRQRRSIQLAENGLERIQFILDGLRLSVAFDEVLEADKCLVSTLCARTMIYTEPYLKLYHQKLKFEDFTANALVIFPAQILLKVLEILIINACEAGAMDSIITVVIKPSSNSIDFEVKDSGRGIDPSVAQHIFEPFYSTKKTGVGKGLGLSIARHLMESQKGRLHYLAERDNTTFVASVPTGHL